MHAATSSARVYFADMPPGGLGSASNLASPPVSIRTSRVRTARPPSFAEITRARHMSTRGQSAALDWEEEDVLGPDVTRRETLLLLAKMTSDAYVTPGASQWYNLTDEWNVVRGPARRFVSCACVHKRKRGADVSCVGYAGRVGARRRWLPRVRLCDRRQYHRRAHDQGHVCPDHRRGAYDREGQAERQPAFQLLLRARQQQVDARVRLLPRRLEMQPGMRRGCSDRRQPLLPNWRCARTPPAPFRSSPLTPSLGKTEFIQQHHRNVPQRRHMDHWPLTRRRACFALGSHVRRTRCGVRTAS